MLKMFVSRAPRGAVLPLLAIVGCIAHVPQVIVAASAPLPVGYVESARVTVEDCDGKQGMEDLYQELKGGHDALVAITISETVTTVPIFTFLGTRCTSITATPVDLPKPAASTVEVDAAPVSPRHLLELVYAAIGRPAPTDAPTIAREEEVLATYGKHGWSASKIVAVAHVGVGKLGSTATLDDILLAGFAASTSEP